MNVSSTLLLPVFLILTKFQFLSYYYVYVHGDSADHLVHEKVIRNDSKLYVECINETLVNPKLVLKLISGSKITNPNHSLKQWVLCVLVKKKIMSPRGVVQIDEALAQVGACRENSVEELIDRCIPTPKPEDSNKLKLQLQLPHEIAWAYITCYNQGSNEAWRFI